MNKYKIWILILGSIFLLCGCNKKENKVTAEIFAMDTVIHLTVYGEQGEAAISQAKKMIREYETKFSVTDSNSDVTKVNDRAGEKVTVSPETYELVKESLKISAQTEGAFDISIYPLVKAWGFTQEKYRVPTETERKEAKRLVDYKRIECLPDNQIRIKKGMAIDLGGIAKGYTSHKLIERFKEIGVTSAIVSLGGNVETLGVKEEGGLFQVGIQNPFKENELLGTLSTKDTAVITSGSYERYFEQDGIRYHHILDRTTGSPAESDLVSVTVIGSNGIWADGLSTALFVMGSEKAMKFQKEHKNMELILVNKRGEIMTSTENLFE